MTDVTIHAGDATVTGRFRRVRIRYTDQCRRVVDVQIVVEGCPEDIEQAMTQLKQAVSDG